jgi:hypothetical protein
MKNQSLTVTQLNALLSQTHTVVLCHYKNESDIIELRVHTTDSSFLTIMNALREAQRASQRFGYVPIMFDGVALI